jgi:hypothetical protein
MMTYGIRVHRWIHHIYPWNLGVVRPHRKLSEVTSFCDASAA